MLARPFHRFGFLMCLVLFGAINAAAVVPAAPKNAATNSSKNTATAPKGEPKRVNCDCLGVDSSANSAAEAWLQIVDRGDYLQAYTASSCVVHHYHNNSSWAHYLQKQRQCLGQVEGRDLACAAPTCGLPGMPSGQYMVLQYNTCFCNSDPVCEVIYLRHERDCACCVRWKVAHYSIR